MLNAGFLKIATIITGILVSGEALALLVGMYILSPRPNPRISGRNTLWIVLDIAGGIGLLWLVLRQRIAPWDAALLAITVILVGTHVYREWEYFSSSAPDRFLANLPLFILNTLKLLGLVLIGGNLAGIFFV